MIQISLYACAFVGSIIWFFKSPNYEPAITSALALASLLSSIFANRKIVELTRLTQTQTVTKGSTAMQANGDINIRDKG